MDNLKTKRNLNPEGGQIFLLVLMALGVVLFTVLSVVGGAQLYYQNAAYSVDAERATAIAEAGVDKAFASLNSTGGSYSGEPETMLSPGSFSVTITSPNANTKVIESTGYIPSRENAKVKRTIKMSTAKGIGVAFNYGVQVGDGGLQMEENSRINGSVYSNGNIKMQNNSTITGDAWVAAGTQGTPDQQSDCLGTDCGDFLFGKLVNGKEHFDVAQSFQLNASYTVNKVAVKLKKFGNPPDLTVRILGNKRTYYNRPNKNDVKATGTLYAGMVTSFYGFPEVVFANPPSLTAGQLYWLMIDTNPPNYSYTGPNYWSWSLDAMEPRRQASWVHDWAYDEWTFVSGGELDFKVFVGGGPTSIEGTSGASIGGDAHANTLKNLTVTKGAYYQALQNVTAGSYHPNSPDPPAKVMPISEGNIAEWKGSAASSGVYTGNITSCRSELESGKYVGNVSFSNGCIVTIKGIVWVSGNLSLNNNVTLKLDPAFGAASGVIIVDGQVDLSNNVKLQGSGTTGSFLMVLSTYNSQTSGLPAIDVRNGGNSGILYASEGIAKIENNNRLSELTAWKIELENGVIVDYDQGLASSFFTSGPSGSYSLIKGTYQVK